MSRRPTSPPSGDPGPLAGGGRCPTVARMGETTGMSRRTMLKGAGAAGLMAAVPALAPRTARAAAGPSIDWPSFDAAAARQFRAMGCVGAAYAVVNAAGVLHARTLGVR